MSGVIVDIFVVLVIVSLAAFGYRSGVLKAGSAMVGLLIGLAVAIPTASAVGRQIDSTAWRLGVVVGLLVLISNLGYVAGMRVGEKLKARVRRPLARGLDQAIGGLLSTALAVFLVWLIAVPLANSPAPAISKAVRGSVILPYVDSAMPNAARSLYDAINSVIRQQGLPDVVGPLQETNVADVGQPDGAASADPEVLDASRSVVKVVGQATKCQRVIDGSGWVYAEGRVVTNAHVVAGTSSLSVQVGTSDYAATVVYSDESLDIAVLKVPGLDRPPLPYKEVIEPPGTDVVVVGHPGGGDLTLAPAKVRAEGKVTGPVFRGTELVTREVMTLRGTVVPGNSGGPVIDLDGTVVGVVFGAAADKPDVGYALTIGGISDELNAAMSANDKVVTGECYP